MLVELCLCPEQAQIFMWMSKDDAMMSVAQTVLSAMFPESFSSLRDLVPEKRHHNAAERLTTNTNIQKTFACGAKAEGIEL